MSHNFAAVKLKALNLPKITYFVVLGNLITWISQFENLTKQEITGRPFTNMVYRARNIGIFLSKSVTDRRFFAIPAKSKQDSIETLVNIFLN